MPLKSSGESGTLAALRGIVPSSLLPAQSGSDIGRFVAILKSRTLAEQVVRDNTLNLENRLYKDVPEDERPEFQKIVNGLRGIVEISTKEGLILVKAKVAEDPQLAADISNKQLAADISNKYPELLEAYLKENTLTSTRRNRKFIEEQYKKVERNLQLAEKRLNKFKKKYGLTIGSQMVEITGRISTLKGQLLNNQIRLEVMENRGISRASSQYQTLKYEIDVLREQINSLEKGSQKSDIGYAALEELPELESEYIQLTRDKALQETLYTMLAREYEQIKIAEDRDEPAFLTVDEAIPPLRPSSSKRGKIIVLLGGMLGLMLSVMYIVIAEAFKDVKLSDIISKGSTGEE